MAIEYKRLVREFRDGDRALSKKVLDEALRFGDFEVAQEALNCIRTGMPPNPFSIKTSFQRGQIVTVLRGPKGALQFVLSVMDIYVSEGSHDYRIRGIDLGYHSFVPKYEGQIGQECEVLEGSTCYYDGSGLAAHEFVPQLFYAGQEALEKFLMEKYEQIFGDD